MYKDGMWGEKAKTRAKKRLQYFQERYHLKKGNPDLSPRIGKKGELMALTLLPGSERIERVGGKTDLLWNGYQIDVKTSNLLTTKRGLIWRFHLKTQHNYADYYLLLSMDKNKLKRLFLLPNVNLKTGITISLISKRFNKFEITNMKINKQILKEANHE